MSASDHPEPTSVPFSSGSGRWSTTEAARVKARKFFEHAKKAAETRNYDYAIKLYTDGLSLWPDAVEAGLKPLRVVAMARHLDGGKPAGFLAARKLPTAGKDVLEGLGNAYRLFGLDPTNLGHLQTVLKLAQKLGSDRVVAWVAPVLAEAYHTSKKLPESHYEESCAAMAASADLAMMAGDAAVAMEILNANIAVAQIWHDHHPDSSKAPKARSDASGKLTIVKGKFDRAEGFTESLRDAQSQHDLRDRERPVHSASRAEELIARARAEWEANRAVPAKLIGLVDLMVKSEDEAAENAAIQLLEEEFAASDQYILRHKADDLRMKQLGRRRRMLMAERDAAPHDAALQNRLAEATREQLEGELRILLDRQRHYPTDVGLRFQIGVRLFGLNRFDEAIPMFQQALGDGRTRLQSRLYIGRCFLEKHFLKQAIETLQSAVGEVEIPAAPVSLELNYWLARGLEAAARNEEAEAVYGRLIQIDYNHRDARQRLERLVGKKEN